MFWSTPKLPITVDEKKWIEQHFLWLLGVFGKDYFLKKEMILPEARFFPDKFKGTEQCVTTLVSRVCGYMDIDPGTVDVYFTADTEDLALKHRLGGDKERKPGAAGLYYGKHRDTSKWTIAINTSQFKNPTSLVGTIAHELGHVILLGGGKISREEKGHEHLTDLLTVFMGMGIFNANSAFQFSQWHDHSHQGWQASRLGYLSEEAFAYSLAAWAWLRNDPKPAWSSHLAMNVGSHFKECQKYLWKTGDTSLEKLV